MIWVIEDATASDLALLAQLYLDGRQTTFRWVAPSLYRLEDFAEHSAGETMRVARAEPDGIAGFISYCPQEGFIHMLYVDRAWQSRGVGTALLETLPGWGSRPYRLKCLTRNRPALRFYAQRGFEPVGKGDGPDGAYKELAHAGRDRSIEVGHR